MLAPTNMTKRQRVLASIRQQPHDALPWQFDLTSAVCERLRLRLQTADLLTALDEHMLLTSLSDPATVAQVPTPEGCRRDAFGAVWRREAADHAVGDWGALVSHPLHEPSLSGYTFPDPLAGPPRTDAVAQMRREYPEHFLWIGGGGLFERAWSLCGFEPYLGYIAGEEAFVQELTERLADYACQELSLLAGLGLDAVRFGDDWGFQHTLMIRPAVWRRLYKKAYARVFQAVHALGLVTMLHSCGHVEAIIPDLIEAGLDVLHPLQPEANDVVRCQREFGRDITFWGALGSQSTLPYGTVADVRREVRNRLALFHRGGYILAPAGAAPAETPAENIIAIAEEARAQLQ